MRLLALALSLGLAGCLSAHGPGARAAPETAYVFGWGDLPIEIARPRGGTVRGGPVTLAEPRSLPLPEIAAAPDDFARDRAAILSLAGDYRASFHFLEVVGLRAGDAPRQPYFSWGTEQIAVIEDSGTRIRLQHTLVMFIQGEDGSVSEPILVKHWRQDWTYQPSEIHTFRGRDTWARRRISPEEAKGAWAQAVFQVDDSPRYAALGRWEHRGNASVWSGEREWRPLPRREHAVRHDYDVMEGAHRIVLTPTGWLHEQQNWKRVAGESEPTPGYVGEEWGLDRYERIVAPSLAAADDQWRTTGPYWAIVRRVWSEVFSARDAFAIRGSVDGKSLFEHHEAYVERLLEGQPFDAADAERDVRATLERFLTDPAP